MTSSVMHKAGKYIDQHLRAIKIFWKQVTIIFGPFNAKGNQMYTEVHCGTVFIRC